jgi:hypothetical protein
MPRIVFQALATLILVALQAGHATEGSNPTPLQAESVADVRCLIVGSSMMADEATRGLGPSVTLYFLGRLDGRAPFTNLETAIATEAGRMTSDDLRSETRRCVEDLRARGRAITEIGHRLESAGAERKGSAIGK